MTLATDGVIGTNGGPYTPGTAYVLFHHCMGGVGGKRGLWGFVRGGMGGVTQALAASAAQLRGGDPHPRAGPANPGDERSAPTGVVLTSGEEIRRPESSSPALTPS